MYGKTKVLNQIGRASKKKRKTLKNILTNNYSVITNLQCLNKNNSIIIIFTLLLSNYNIHVEMQTSTRIK